MPYTMCMNYLLMLLFLSLCLRLDDPFRRRWWWRSSGGTRPTSCRRPSSNNIALFTVMWLHDLVAEERVTFHPMRDEKTYCCALFWHEQRHFKDEAGLRQEEGKMKGRKERKKEEINCTRSLRSSFLPTWYCLGYCPYLNKLISSVALLG